MCTRLMLSLKKAANPSDESWSLGQPTMRTMRFIDDRGGLSGKEEFRLSTFIDTQGETQTRA